VRLLLSSLPRFVADATDAQQQQPGSTEQPPERAAEEGAQTVADIFRALHYICLLNPTNTARLLAEGGYPLVVQGMIWAWAAAVAAAAGLVGLLPGRLWG
jgi:hypothetical protein